MEQKGERERTEDLKKGSHRSGSREDEKDKRREERREEGQGRNTFLTLPALTQPLRHKRVSKESHGL